MSFLPLDYCVPCGTTFNQGSSCAFCEHSQPEWEPREGNGYQAAPELENSMNVPYPDPES